MRRALLPLLLLLGGAAAFAQESELNGIERDIASVDTKVRSDAVVRLMKSTAPVSSRAFLLRQASRDPSRGIREMALERLFRRDLRHKADSIGAAVDAIDDPEPTVAGMARQQLLVLEGDDFRHVDVARMEAVLLREPTENDRFHVVQILENILEIGGIVSVGPLLAVAAVAEHPILRDRALGVAYKAALVASITSADLPAIQRLLAAGKETRAATVQIAFRAFGPVSARLLVELEATTTDEEERVLLKKTLDAYRESSFLPPVLEDLAKNAPDERVREVAKRRLRDGR